MWRDAGIPLRYQSSTFSMTATHVETGIDVDRGMFATPSNVAPTEPGAFSTTQAERVLDAIAVGDLRPWLELIQPGMTASADAPRTSP